MKITCKIERANLGGLESKPDLIVNGQKIDLPIGKTVELEQGIVEAAEASDTFIVTRSPAEDSGEGDGAAAQPGGLDAGGADTAQNDDAPDRTTTEITPAEGDETGESFDAKAVLEGNLSDVKPRIEKLETLDQVKAVRKAAGKNARKGTLDALDARETALKGE